MTSESVSKRSLVAVVTVLVAALIARTALQVRLRDGGMSSELAADLSYLVVPPIVALLIAALWRDDRRFILRQFRFASLNVRLLLQALAIGVLLRAVWWSQLVAGASFGLHRSREPIGPAFSFDCGPLPTLLLGIVVMVLFVPIIEELLHRAYVQTFFKPHGMLVAILMSSIIFTVLHPFSNWGVVLLAGIALGIQYWATQLLWPSLVTHMTFNGLVILDWRCLSGRWSPDATDIPVLLPGIAAVMLLISSLGALGWMLKHLAAGAERSPRQPRLKARSRRAR